MRRNGRGAGRGGSGGSRQSIFWVVRTVLGLGLFCALVAIAGLVGMFSYYGSDPKLPTLKALGDYHPKQVTRILDRNGAVIGELGTEKRTVIPYDQIPKILVKAVVAAEDAEYFHHDGIDYRGMVRAFIENVLRGRTAQGGSTITQQVVKTFLLSPERTMRRKVQEIILARQLSQKFSKEEVLGLYLNQIYYGHGRYGCEEAARYFFGKSVRDINVAEAALLAGLPQSPERLSPRKHPEAAKTRQRYVLGRMAETGAIPPSVATKLAAEPIRLARESGAARGMAGEAVDGVGRFLAEKYGERAAFELGTTVETTIDARMQDVARQSLERGLEDLDARQGFRGPSGHLTGKALARRTAELQNAREGGRKDSAIFEGIVTRIDKGDMASEAPATEASDAKPSRGGQGPQGRRQGRRSSEALGGHQGRDRGPRPEEGTQEREDLRRHRRRGRRRRSGSRAALHEGRQAARRSVLARRSDPRAARHRALARRGHAVAAGAGAGPAGGDGGAGSDDAPGAGAGRRLRVSLGRFRSLAPGAPAAGVGVQADLLLRGDRIEEDHRGDGDQRLARGLRAVEAAELREGVPGPGARADGAGAFDQHRLDQDPVAGRPARRARGGDALRPDACRRSSS